MILIENGTLMTMAGGVWQENGFILIHDGKITAVGGQADAAYQELDRSRCSRIIDASGKWVLPGLVDAHCHIGLFNDSLGFEGEDGNEATDPITPHLRAVDGIYHADRGFADARRHGVTTVVTGPGSANVFGGQFAALKTAGRCVDEMVFKAPAALKVAFGENPKTVYNDKKQCPTTRMTTAALMRETLFKAKHYAEALKKHEEKPDDHDKPDFDMKLEALLPALRREIPVKAHAHREDDILTALRIAEEFGLWMTIEHATESHLIAELLAEKGVSVVLGPVMTDRSKPELRNLSLAGPGVVAKAGVPVALMTDHPVIPEEHLAVQAALCCREGMPEKLALEAITLQAARACGIADRVGSLETGKDADVAVFSGHPFDWRTRVELTLIDGHVVFERN